MALGPEIEPAPEVESTPATTVTAEADTLKQAVTDKKTVADLTNQALLNSSFGIAGKGRTQPFQNILTEASSIEIEANQTIPGMPVSLFMEAAVNKAAAERASAEGTNAGEDGEASDHPVQAESPPAEGAVIKTLSEASHPDTEDIGSTDLPIGKIHPHFDKVRREPAEQNPTPPATVPDILADPEPFELGRSRINIRLIIIIIVLLIAIGICLGIYYSTRNGPPGIDIIRKKRLVRTLTTTKPVTRPPLRRPVRTRPVIRPAVRRPVRARPVIRPLVRRPAVRNQRRPWSHRALTRRYKRRTARRKATSSAKARTSRTSITTTPLSKKGPMGYLTVTSNYWSYVRIGGTKLGATPVIRFKLPIGRHPVRVFNPENKKSQIKSVIIRAGKLTALQVNWH